MSAWPVIAAGLSARQLSHRRDFTRRSRSTKNLAARVNVGDVFDKAHAMGVPIHKAAGRTIRRTINVLTARNFLLK